MCQGTTTKGSKCKLKDEPYCKYHKPIPIIKGFTLDITRCTTKIQKKLQTIMKKGPSKTDGKGHIYAYWLDCDEYDTYYKVGRTSRDVDKRLKEWKGAIYKVSWPVKYQKLAEKLIHVYLDHVRVYRYELAKNTICTIWKTSGEPVEDSDEDLKEKYKLEARTKMIEWFYMPWKELEKNIKMILAIDLLNI
jgi:hypothetical protein